MQLNTHDFPSAGVREAALYWLSGGMSTLSEGQRRTLPLTICIGQIIPCIKAAN